MSEFTASKKHSLWYKDKFDMSAGHMHESSGIDPAIGSLINSTYGMAKFFNYVQYTDKIVDPSTLEYMLDDEVNGSYYLGWKEVDNGEKLQEKWYGHGGKIINKYDQTSQASILVAGKYQVAFITNSKFDFDLEEFIGLGVYMARLKNFNCLPKISNIYMEEIEINDYKVTKDQNDIYTYYSTLNDIGLQMGSSYDIKLKPGYLSAEEPISWAIFMDWEEDGFDEDDRIFYQQGAIGDVNTNIYIPDLTENDNDYHDKYDQVELRIIAAPGNEVINKPVYCASEMIDIKFNPAFEKCASNDVPIEEFGYTWNFSDWQIGPYIKDLTVDSKSKKVYINDPLKIGYTYPISISKANYDDFVYDEYHIKMWLDYNQNNEFDEFETIYEAPLKSLENLKVEFEFEIPLTALVGKTRLRVMYRKDTPPVKACDYMENATVIDFFVSLISFDLSCPAVTNVVPQNLTSTSAFLTWDPSYPIATYEVRYKEVGGEFNYQYSEEKSIVIDGLEPGKQYFYQIRSLCNAQDVYDQYSNLASFFTLSEQNCTYDAFDFGGESNDNFIYAPTISIAKDYIGGICYDDVDWFKFKLNSNFNFIQISLLGEMEWNLPANLKLSLYNEDYQLLKTSNKAGLHPESIQLSIGSGEYYIKIEGISEGSYAKGYKLKVDKGFDEGGISEGGNNIIYPNPVIADQLTIQLEQPANDNWQVTLYNHLGENQTQNISQIIDNTRQQITLNRMNQLRPGLYKLTVWNGRERSSHSIIVE